MFINEAVFVSIVEDVLCVCWLGVVEFYISDVFLVPLPETGACFSYIRHLAWIARESIYSTLVYLLWIAGYLLFHELLNSIGSFERYSYVGLLEKICNFPYFWAVVCEGGPYLVFVSIVFILAGFFMFDFLV